MPQPIDTFAANLSEETRATVLDGAEAGFDMRKTRLHGDYDNVDRLRRLAGNVKQHTLDHLDEYLDRAVARMEGNGAKVHFAADSDEARKAILDILRRANATRVVKSKSMATEEVHLNAYLEENGVACVETDLGEFIVQLDEDTPSHIIKPIMHKNRRQIAETFEKHGLGDYNTDPQTITRRARAHLRSRYMECDAGITGANFVSAESGRIVIVTNEGNARFCLAPAKIHIALIGIEKIVPGDRDFGLFLNLLGRSATGQQLTIYTEFISGPRKDTQPHGPEEMHVIFLDNGRSQTLGSDCREILRCIRCGACQNVCPVYRQATGHAYRHVYGGPIGAVLGPLLAGKQFADYADLPKASSLCGACNEVCPVDIPIPDLLLKLRNKAHRESVPSPGALPMQPFAKLATHPGLWRMAMRGGAVTNFVPDAAKLPVPGLGTWLQQRTLPAWRGGKFRKWMEQHTKSDG
jgi:L-lactate dehydrogenase complex protein LldF